MIQLRVPGPDGSETLYDYWDRDGGARIKTLDTGSDFNVFQDFTGIPSVDISFKSYGDDSIYEYHSDYDSFYWMDHFGDPDWKYHTTLTKYWGLITLALSETTSSCVNNAANLF